MGESAGPIRVLVVDDHQLLTQALFAALDGEDGIEVVGAAGSVEEGCSLAASRLPDVVLMDHRLPDGNGVEAARAIRAERPDTKVVMLTATTDDEVLVAAIEAGCSGYITKHRSVAELVAAVRSAHAGEVLISPAMLARLLPKLRPQPRGVAELSVREREVLTLVAEAMTTPDIAKALYLSQHTVRNHIQNILNKLGAHSKLEAVATAIRTGLIRYPGGSSA